MTIEQIRTVTVGKGSGTMVQSNYVFVLIETDSGLRGLGEGFHSLDEPIAASVSKFARLLIGEDPGAVTRNWQRVYRGLRYPLGTAELSALSAIEHALWDIAGKQMGMPIFRLLGGPTRDRIRLYSGLKADGSDPAVAATKVVARGFGALKFSAQPPDYASIGEHEVIHKAVARVRAVHIIQPEPTANGGILETFKLAAMAETAHIVVAPHQACSPVSLLVNAHIDAAIPNFLIQEQIDQSLGLSLIHI